MYASIKYDFTKIIFNVNNINNNMAVCNIFLKHIQRTLNP